MFTILSTLVLPASASNGFRFSPDGPGVDAIFADGFENGRNFGHDFVFIQRLPGHLGVELQHLLGLVVLEAQSSGVMDSKNTDICSGNGEKRIEAMQRRYSGVFEAPEPRSFGNGDDPHGVEEVDIGNLPRRLRAVCRIERLSKQSSVWLLLDS